MGRLANYFMSLRNGNRIDDELMDIILHPRLIPDVPSDPAKRENLTCLLPIQIPKYNAVYSPWIPGSVCVVNADMGKDVISAPFSGCWMARIPTTMGFDECYHIHTGDRDKKSFWNNEFILFLEGHSQYNTDIGKLFRPPPTKLEKAMVLGIISSCGKCLSILLCKDGNDWKKRELSLCKPMPNMRIPNY